MLVHKMLASGNASEMNRIHLDYDKLTNYNGAINNGYYSVNSDGTYVTALKDFCVILCTYDSYGGNGINITGTRGTPRYAFLRVKLGDDTYINCCHDHVLVPIKTGMIFTCGVHYEKTSQTEYGTLYNYKTGLVVPYKSNSNKIYYDYASYSSIVYSDYISTSWSDYYRTYKAKTEDIIINLLTNSYVSSGSGLNKTSYKIDDHVFTTSSISETATAISYDADNSIFLKKGDYFGWHMPSTQSSSGAINILTYQPDSTKLYTDFEMLKNYTKLRSLSDLIINNILKSEYIRDDVITYGNGSTKNVKLYKLTALKNISLGIDSRYALHHIYRCHLASKSASGSSIVYKLSFMYLILFRGDSITFFYDSTDTTTPATATIDEESSSSGEAPFIHVTFLK